MKRYVIIFLLGGLVFTMLTKAFWPTVKFKIKEIEVGVTEHHDGLDNADVNNPEDCKGLKECRDSKINVNAWIEDDIVYGIAYDACKSAKFGITLQVQPVYYKHILQANYLIQYHKDDLFTSYSFSYYYNFGRLAVGGGIIGSYPDLKKNYGVQAGILLLI